MELLKPLQQNEFKNQVSIYFNQVLDGFHLFSNGQLSHSDFNKSDQEKEVDFTNFFRDCFTINSKDTIVDLYLKNLNQDELQNLLMFLDNKNKEFLLNQLKHFNNDTIYFKVPAIEAMDFITLLNCRSLFFCTVYFTKYNFTIWGNYDFKFPVFFCDKDTLKIYNDIAIKNNLIISNLNFNNLN